jgi:septin family protein
MKNPLPYKEHIMNIAELRGHYDHYRKLGINTERSQNKAIDAYNSAHPRDKMPPDIWQKIGGPDGDVMLKASTQNSEISALNTDNNELAQALKQAAQTIRRQENEIEAKEKTIAELGKQIAELTAEVESLAGITSVTENPVDDPLPEKTGQKQKGHKTKKK